MGTARISLTWILLITEFAFVPSSRIPVLPNDPAAFVCVKLNPHSQEHFVSSLFWRTVGTDEFTTATVATSTNWFALRHQLIEMQKSRIHRYSDGPLTFDFDGGMPKRRFSLPRDRESLL